MIRRAFLVALLLAACTHRPPQELPPPSSSRIDEGETAAYNSEFSRAKTIFAEVVAKDAKRENRDRAALRLATIHWRIDENYDGARHTLAPLTEDGPEQWSALLELARLERSAKNWSAAQSAASRSRNAARTESERRSSITSYALSVIEPEKQRVLAGETVSDVHALREAVDLVRVVVDAEPGRLQRSLALLDGGVLLRDPEAIRAGWSSYFVAAAPSKILDHARELVMGDNIAQGLVESRLFDEAVMFDPSLHEVARYARFVRDATQRTNDYYRRIAQNQGVVKADDRAVVEKDLRAIAQSVWKDIIGTPFDEKEFDEKRDGELARRFGTFVSVGETGGRLDVHAGHRVLDDSREVEQYGRRATTRFIVLDTMISNGYESWARDGRAQHGGWASEGLIIQVRPAYAEGSLGPWRRLTDPEERKKADEEIARETAKDYERAAKDPYAYLPGLALRLRRQSAERTLAKFPQREQWIAEMVRMTQESSIFAHEGRHAIDAHYAKIEDDAELEFRAKLSEIAFAPDPRLGLTGGIISSDIGSSSPHGKANTRIMKGLVAWMKTHANVDQTRPLLPQLDKLTDDELREAARSMDPWATAIP
ncbi:MAG TPA: hypothetical protein VMU84_21200 [Thermoanaerobaculia bacterium]|nr:hypothetical protein [Thermoanaerobaculia bacterium]